MKEGILNLKLSIMWRSPLQAIRQRLSWIEVRSLTKTENGNMRKNRKWIKEETLDASKNRKYIFGIGAQPFLSLSIFSVVSEEKNIWLFI